MLQRSNVYSCKNHAKGICAIEVRKIYFEGKSHPKGSNSSFKVYSRRENGTFKEVTESLVGDKKTGWKVLLGQQGRGEHF